MKLLKLIREFRKNSIQQFVVKNYNLYFIYFFYIFSYYFLFFRKIHFLAITN